MKKLPYIVLIFLAIQLLVSPQIVCGKLKSAKQAEKLAGDFTKIDQAREKAQEALKDSAADTERAYSFYVAGRIEEGAFKHYQKLLGINRADPNVDRTAMADALLSTLNYYERALTLDTVINKKGERQTNYSQRIAEWLNSVTPSLYNAGVAYMNKRMYYPQAYNAFKAYALAPTKYYFTQQGQKLLSDSVQAEAWFYAGVMAYNAKEFSVAAQAFSSSRKQGYKKKEAWLNEMSCITHLVKIDTIYADSLSRKLTFLAGDGYKRFNMQSPEFIKRYVAGLLYESKPDSALNVVDDALKALPDNYMLHSMKAALLQGSNRNEEAVKEYLIATATDKADLTTLKEGSRTIASYGICLLEKVSGTRKSARDKRAEIKNNYLSPALAIAERAQAMQPEDPDIANTIETINYYMH